MIVSACQRRAVSACKVSGVGAREMGGAGTVAMLMLTRKYCLIEVGSC